MKKFIILYVFYGLQKLVKGEIVGWRNYEKVHKVIVKKCIF